MERKLASIQKVTNIRPIPDADKIEQVQVLGWNIVTKKGEFKEGDLCVFFEIDSLLPIEAPWAAFMEPRGFRVKTCKLRKTLSQGLALPINILPQDTPLELEADVTEVLGVKKYEPKTPARLRGLAKGSFPGFIPKTDETRVQSCMRLLYELQGHPYYITEKVDGSSGTFFVDDEGELHVCSRNLELKESEDNAFWKVAHKYKLANKIPRGIAVQGEVYGPGIQKNRLQAEELSLAIFTVFDFKEHIRWSYTDMVKFCKETDLPMVKTVEINSSFNHDLDSLLELARGKYQGTKNNREGIVVRPLDPERTKTLQGGWLSFKVINNDFLLKDEE